MTKSDIRIAREAADSARDGILPFLPRKPSHWLGVTATLVVVGIVAAIVVNRIGFLDLSVRSNYPPFVGDFLHSTYIRSQEFHADFVGDAPDLTTDAIIDRGGGHFGTTCVFCHGGPDVSANIVAKHMDPPPPPLMDNPSGFSSEAKFWLIENGLKMAAMPAWPVTGRDDEVWSMVAFVNDLADQDRRRFLELTQGAVVAPDAAELRRTAFATGGADDWPVEEQEILAAQCARCHAWNGQGRPSGAFPLLGIQDAAYLERMLKEYASGQKRSGIMQTVAVMLTDGQKQRLAAYYAAQPPLATPPAADAPPDLIARGKQIAENGIPDRNVEACLSCHNDALGPQQASIIPMLHGQYPEYIVYKLRVWENLRPGDPWEQMMSSAVHDLTAEDEQAVAAFFGAQAPLGQSATDSGPGTGGASEAAASGAADADDAAAGGTGDDAAAGGTGAGPGNADADGGSARGNGDPAPAAE